MKPLKQTLFEIVLLWSIKIAMFYSYNQAKMITFLIDFKICWYMVIFYKAQSLDLKYVICTIAYGFYVVQYLI